MRHTDQRGAVVALELVLALVLAGCGTQRVAALSLRSATSSPPPVATVLSCQGHGLCREDSILAGPHREDAMEDVIDDCARRGGTSSPTACSRDAALASCSLASEVGSITVLTYGGADGATRAEVLEEMSSRCDDFGGSFTLATK